MGRRKRSGGRKEEDNGDVRGGAGAGPLSITVSNGLERDLDGRQVEVG